MDVRKRLFAGAVVAALAAAVGWGGAAQAQVVKGNGTTSTVPLWTSNSTVGNSIISQSGGSINVNGGVKASGQVTAPSFSGNGSALSNVNASTLGNLPPNAFAQLNAGANLFSGTVSASAFSGNGSGLSNVNASMLGGLGPSGFAQLGAANTFSANQTINGLLTLSGSINNTLTLQSNLIDSVGDKSGNVIGGFGGDNILPGNSVANGVVGATIAGGGGGQNSASLPNTVTDAWGTVGGGAGNAAGRFGTVCGGRFNGASGNGSTACGGSNNSASGTDAFVTGGSNNVAGGDYSMVAGGQNNFAGRLSFAAGYNATASSDGSFVWNDSSPTNLHDFGPNTFSARASGGFVFYTGVSSGAYLPAGSGSWASVSDRNMKANLIAVDGHAILERLASLPIATWNYTTQSDSVRHMGPMAQDFRAAFGLGEDEKHISAVDSEGVALAAIQTLYREKQQEATQLRDRLAALEARLATLEASK